ncbi:restriction endonuclease subunit S [Enterococcus durans]|nr:restriction endonuclease subunit S [Enterococcus durans]MCT4341384.1 restriction endonuclease subunit S [Enterococcus durans]
MPESWEWVRFSEVSTIVRGGSPRPIKEFITEADDGINWIKIGDTDKGGKFINSTKEKIKPSGLKKTRYVTKGTFLLTNSMSFGRPYILNVDGAIHDGWLAISNYEEVFSRDFLYYLLSSKVAYHQFLALISGAVVKNLNSDKVASLLVPVPPQKEQERIVSAIMVGLPKVDDYQKLHDRLEKINKELPEKLRKSILQYAMQGKLVPQDPNDEPVEVLLEKIRQEKQKLFEEGKLKKKDLQESIIYKGDDNSYYEKSGKMAHKIDVPHDDLPANWKWSRLSQLGILIRGSGIKKNETTAEGIGCVRYGELYTTYDYFFTSTKSFTTRKVAEKSKEIATSDILMTLTGENKEDIGKATVYLAEEKIVMGGDLTKLTGHNMNPVFLSLLLNSPQIISQKSSVATGNIIVHISNDKLGKMLVLVPPLPEQAKIVTQVEGLNLQISQLPE